MSILEESGGPTEACDGCGRTDAGPGQTLQMKAYIVNDPNIGSAVTLNFCGGCASNRTLEAPAETIPGWDASPA